MYLVPDVQTLDTASNNIPVTCLRSHLNSFETWLAQTGSARITAKTYRKGVDRWLCYCAQDLNTPPALQWLQWTASPSVKRSVGYALRAFQLFLGNVPVPNIQIWIPRRLPPASRPRPREVEPEVIRNLCLAAKRLFPTETGLTMRIWIQFLAESAVRRSESEIAWDNLDWTRESVAISGKTGARELPLSKKMMRRFAFLLRRGRVPGTSISNSVQQG